MRGQSTPVQSAVLPTKGDAGPNPGSPHIFAIAFPNYARHTAPNEGVIPFIAAV